MLHHIRCSLVLLLIYSTASLETNIKRSENISLNTIRAKRQINSLPLVFPFGGSNKFIVAIGFPIPLREKYVSMAFAMNMQFQYPHFDNVSALSKYYFIKTVSRDQRDAGMAARKNERLSFYKSAANMLDAKGYNGLECVLRAICEAAQYPVEGEALIGEIIHILLTPDYGHSPFEDTEWLEATAPYQDAAVAGRQMFNCAYIYSGCPEGRGVLELISELRDE